MNFLFMLYYTDIKGLKDWDFVPLDSLFHCVRFAVPDALAPQLLGCQMYPPIAAITLCLGDFTCQFFPGLLSVHFVHLWVLRVWMAGSRT